MLNVKDILNTVICEDSLKVMKELPDNSIDLIITDPPYGIGIKGKVGGGKVSKSKRLWRF